MSPLSRRAVLAGLVGLGTAAALTACGDDEQSAAGGSGGGEPVKLGYIADFTGASLMAIAQEKKLWAQHGLKPDLKVFTNGPLQVQALGAGDLDFGYLGPGAMWLPASGKARVIAVNSLGFADRVIAQPGITSIAALKGKKIGVPEGTSGDMIVRLALRRAGLSIDDVQKVAMDASTVVTAFGSGQIDAAGIWYPLIGTIKKRVPDLTELAKNEDFYPDISFPSAYVGRNDVVTGKPELVKKVLAVLRAANDERAADVEGAVALTAKFLKSAPVDQLRAEATNARFLPSAELAAKSTDGTVAGWLNGLNGLFKDLGKLPDVVDPNTYYDAAAYAS
ncbi:aliphatic sulfonate ABC transporter substrate-binding protein [Micromonospora peucetia]|uniref:Aliphatic sulfonate ABC transporter substrate-binding protein n=1 Tax=Micromonospora peucetia TaxID=47871 RepID=A0A1C6VVU8_9ACTN|nr:aliphatic sulfonate ABC transporter substrate-binding protein [Micromonospora peucetia]MCX4388023.1 aliphatic sulfonate ABC transporter substrate-binding protein [Micromonospora peucetia]WSA31287.1 aliphatic sulfonate ABC transporter substrate-binding protein [Micromonospora peucetia]SCL70327.1 NitT/TauT family transport system substrate-binding protein [Micromonospora peucetia]